MENNTPLAIIKILSEITRKVNEGFALEDVLNHIYDSFKVLIPYDRIGVAFLENENKDLTALWAKTEAEKIVLEIGYSQPMEGSSLQTILETKQPRILNNLKQYLKEHPNSESTDKIVQEGMMSSLTCPLIALNKPIGFMFFSNMKRDIYKNIHTELFLQISREVSIIIEKSKLYEELLKLNDIKTKFLGIASHDLRNPITVIKESVSIMLEGLTGEVLDEQKKILQTIENSCKKMIGLINTFLDVTIIQAGKLKLKKEKIDFKEFLQECYNSNKLLAKAKSIELKLLLPDNLPEIEIDKERIEQTINNLISNAIKFSSSETTISLKAEKKDKEIHVSILDQGQGIPKEELSHIFEFFKTTSTSPTAKETSTGLGLAISKQIIEAHKGKIWVESEKEKGSIFTFSLPI